MTKTEKKVNNSIVQQLTLACDDALSLATGFQWLTHEVNFKRFPKSLIVTCVFDTWDHVHLEKNQHILRGLCDKYLSQIKIRVTREQIQFHVDHRFKESSPL
jgi:hypothetical protein